MSSNSKEYMRAYMKEYLKDPVHLKKHMKLVNAYFQTKKYKAWKKAYNDAYKKSDKYKAYRKKYIHSETYINYRKSDKYKLLRKEQYKRWYKKKKRLEKLN